MAAARQNEMKVSITVVATKTFTAGFCRFCMDPVDIEMRFQSSKRKGIFTNSLCCQTKRNLLRDSEESNTGEADPSITATT
jgi:hypothetical protein